MPKSDISSEEEDEIVLSPDVDFQLMEGDDLTYRIFPLSSESRAEDEEYEDDGVLDDEDVSDESFLPPIPEELELREFTLWARIELDKGKRFGPIPAQLKESTPPSSSVWKVVDERGTVKAWVDILIARGGQWTAFLRASDTLSGNVCPVFVGGQIYLEVVQHIEAGQELKLSTYNLLLPHETSRRNSRNSSIDGGNGGLRVAVSSPSSENDEFRSNLLASPSSPCSSLKSPNHQHGGHPPPPLVAISNGQDDGSVPRGSSADLDYSAINRRNESSCSHFSEDSGQGEREYKCPQCPKVFNWKSNLIRHQVAHDYSRRYVCENCKKVFTDPSNLQRHIRSQHIGARSHACPECGKTFATSSGLKQHTHIHSSVKPFRCEVCLKAYTQFSNLCRHKRMHATCRMQIKCHKCGQAFSAVTSLSKHKRFCEGSPSARSLSSQQSGSSGKSEQIRASAPMSLAPPQANSLFFYPRTGFPLYSPSLFAYPLFTGAGLPAPPPLIPDTTLLAGQNSLATASNVSQDYPITGSSVSPVASSTSKEKSTSLRSDKSHLEASESDISEELSSDTAGEDVSSISDGESEVETTKSPTVTPQSPRTTSATSNGAVTSTTMFSNHRQGSPKQGAVCPDPTMIMSPLNSHGSLRQAMCNGLPGSEPDMPFDLSRANKIRTQEEASGFHRKPREEKLEDQPLDLRISNKRSFVESDEDSPRKRHCGVEKEQHLKEFTSSNPVMLSSLPSPVPQLEMLKPQSPVSQSPNKLQMAYPRPIHPLFLESMYRLQQEKPPFLFPTPDRMMASFPPRYPFLSPLLGGSSSFDFMRAHMDKVSKPMHEIMSPHLGKAKERYSCKFCGKIFPRSANLTRHLRTHTGEQPYKCKYCERSFSISSNLQRHVRNIHNKEKPFKCPLCDRCFGQQTNLDRHLKKHEADGPTILDDSPKAIEVDDKDETYFDEIRSFIGKVTNNAQLGHPVAPMSLVTSSEDRKHMMLMSALSSRQHSPGSGHSENLDEETDGISPSDQEEESPRKKSRRSVSIPTSSSPSGDSNRSLDSTKGQDIAVGLRNGDAKNHQKALSYEVMMSLNRSLDMTNGTAKSLRKAGSEDELDLEDDGNCLTDDEAEDDEDDEEIDPVKEESPPQKKTVSVE